MKPLISVLMCVYNTSIEYLREAVNSITNQSFREYELIIVDDGSTKADVSEYLSSLESLGIARVIRNTMNIGLTKSLNKGLCECQGEYIARMDADDISGVDRLEKQYIYMEAHKDVCVLGCEINEKKEGEGYLPPYVNYMDDQDLFRIKMLFHNVGPMHPTSMIRKQFLIDHNITYNESVRKAQDYALWIDCLNAGGVFFCLHEKLLNYRIHSDQITLSENKEQNDFIKEISALQWEKVYSISAEMADVLSDFFSDDYDRPPMDYINSISEVLKQNMKNSRHNQKLLKQEFAVRWIHKVFKCAIKSHSFGGFMCLYTYKCFCSKAILIWFRNTVLHIP